MAEDEEIKLLSDRIFELTIRKIGGMENE